MKARALLGGVGHRVWGGEWGKAGAGAREVGHELGLGGKGLGYGERAKGWGRGGRGMEPGYDVGRGLRGRG